MSEQTPRFHNEVEKVIEADPNSADFGRVKDKDLAYDVASTEDRHRQNKIDNPEFTLPNHDERVKEIVDERIKFTIGKNALENSFAMNNFVNGVVASETSSTKYSSMNAPESTLSNVNALKREVSRAVKSYDDLQKEAQERRNIDGQVVDKIA